MRSQKMDMLKDDAILVTAHNTDSKPAFAAHARQRRKAGPLPQCTQPWQHVRRRTAQQEP